MTWHLPSHPLIFPSLLDPWRCCPVCSLQDYEGLKETAQFFGTSELILPAIAHDIMLDVKWEEAANAVLSWIDERVLST